MKTCKQSTCRTLNKMEGKQMLDYLAHESEPTYRPKIQKIIVKQYGLKKFVRIERRKVNK